MKSTASPFFGIHKIDQKTKGDRNLFGSNPEGLGGKPPPTLLRRLATAWAQDGDGRGHGEHYDGHAPVVHPRHGEPPAHCPVCSSQWNMSCQRERSVGVGSAQSLSASFENPFSPCLVTRSNFYMFFIFRIHGFLK